jgi:hypothetical protein
LKKISYLYKILSIKKQFKFLTKDQTLEIMNKYITHVYDLVGFLAIFLTLVLRCRIWPWDYGPNQSICVIGRYGGRSIYGCESNTSLMYYSRATRIKVTLWIVVY